MYNYINVKPIEVPKNILMPPWPVKLYLIIQITKKKLKLFEISEESFLNFPQVKKYCEFM